MLAKCLAGEIKEDTSNSPDILAQCETNLDDSIYSGNFSVRGFLPLIWKDLITHIHGLAVYVKEGLSFAQDLSQKTLQILTYVFDWLYFTQCLTSFSCIDHLLHCYTYFFDSISFNIDEVLSINPSAIVLSLETLASIIMTG